MIYLAQYGQGWVLHGYQLVDQTTGQYVITPTLAAGDFKVEKDGGAAANLGTLPAVAPAGGSSLDITFSAAEMQAKHITLRMVDAAGSEWNDDAIHIFTVGDPNAHFEFDLFSSTVALSEASQGAVTGGVWDEILGNHQGSGTTGEAIAVTVETMEDIQTQLTALQTSVESIEDILEDDSETTPATGPSYVTIANLALQKLGATLIVSPSEDTREARTIAACYGPLRDKELRAHAWNFSIRRRVLAPSTTVPAFDFAAAFAVPEDCLRILPPPRHVDWTIESIDGTPHILTNEGDVVNLRYVAKVTDEATFDTCFAEMLACKIAWHCCETLTQSNSKKADILEEYKMAKADARKVNAFEQPSPEEPEPPWLAARRSGGESNWLRFS
jgi:hypothetical protein